MIVYFQENSLICKCSPIWRRHCDESLCSAPKTSCLPKLPISDVASFFGGKSWNVGKVGKVGKASAAEPSPLIRKSPGCIQCFLLPFFCAVLLAKCRSIFFLFAGAASLRLFQRARSILLEKDETAPPLDAHSHLYIYTYSIPLLHVCEREKQSQRMANDNGKSLDGPQYGVSLLGT